MTGLDVKKDRIIEIACLVTTGNLDLVAEVWYSVVSYVGKMTSCPKFAHVENEMRYNITYEYNLYNLYSYNAVLLRSAVSTFSKTWSVYKKCAALTLIMCCSSIIFSRVHM